MALFPIVNISVLMVTAIKILDWSEIYALTAMYIVAGIFTWIRGGSELGRISNLFRRYLVYALIFFLIHLKMVYLIDSAILVNSEVMTQSRIIIIGIISYSSVVWLHFSDPRKSLFIVHTDLSKNSELQLDEMRRSYNLTRKLSTMYWWLISLSFYLSAIHFLFTILLVENTLIFMIFDVLGSLVIFYFFFQDHNENWRPLSHDEFSHLLLELRERNSGLPLGRSVHTMVHDIDRINKYVDSCFASDTSVQYKYIDSVKVEMNVYRIVVIEGIHFLLIAAVLYVLISRGSLSLDIFFVVIFLFLINLILIWTTGTSKLRRIVLVYLRYSVIALLFLLFYMREAYLVDTSDNSMRWSPTLFFLGSVSMILLTIAHISNRYDSIFMVYPNLEVDDTLLQILCKLHYMTGILSTMYWMGIVTSLYLSSIHSIFALLSVRNVQVYRLFDVLGSPLVLYLTYRSHRKKLDFLSKDEFSFLLQKLQKKGMGLSMGRIIDVRNMFLEMEE